MIKNERDRMKSSAVVIFQNVQHFDRHSIERELVCLFNQFLFRINAIQRIRMIREKNLFDQVLSIVVLLPYEDVILLSFSTIAEWQETRRIEFRIL